MTFSPTAYKDCNDTPQKLSERQIRRFIVTNAAEHVDMRSILTAVIIDGAACIEFRDQSSDNLPDEAYKNFAQRYTEVFANDALRRRSFDTDINSVDLDPHPHVLHAEASFSPTFPKLVSFYYSRASSPVGQPPTTIASGIDLWKSIPNYIKLIFLQHQIRYRLEIPFAWPNPEAPDRYRKWQLQTIGTFDSQINFHTGILRCTQIRSAVTVTATGDIAFVNHLLHSPPDSQIVGMELVGYGELPDDARIELLNIYESHTREWYWNMHPNTLLILDNHQTMHGRRAITNPLSLKSRGLKVLQSARMRV